jgi:hypothetical protein
MKFIKKFSLLFVICILCSTQFIFSLERTEPVDLYLIIDKSLSMDETNSFALMKDWLCNKFLKKCIAMEDFITVFIFYGESKVVYSETIKTPEDLDNLIAVIQEQKADGPFTDIGSVLDNAKKRLDLTPSSRMRVTLLFTDLIQEASYSSKYAGTYYDFADKYLSTDRIVYHEGNSEQGIGSWYEIAVRTASDKSVADMAKKIYENIVASGNSRIYSVQ